MTENDLIKRAKDGDRFAKNEMIRRYKSMLKIKVSAYSRAPVPTAALEGEAMRLLLLTIDKFDPKKGFKFKTYLEQNLRGLYRYTARTKNIARIPEHKVLQITRYKNAKSLIHTQKGREPTTMEMADSLAWSPSQVTSMETSITRRDIAASGIEALHEQERFTDRMEDILAFQYFEMQPEEKLVFDYSLGRHGKPRLESVKDISRRTGLTQDKIYEIKKRLAKKITARV